MVAYSNTSQLPCARLVAGLAAAVVLLLVTAAAATAATRQVAPRGVDSGDCLAAPCASLGYAYGQSAGGDAVQVAPGSYGVQRVPSGSKAVTFRGGRDVVVRQVVNDASNVVFDGINVDAAGSRPRGAAFELGGSGVTVSNARLGNVIDEKVMLARDAGFTVDNVEFHDVRSTAPTGRTTSASTRSGRLASRCRNSTFRDCATMDVFFTYGSWWSPAAARLRERDDREQRLRHTNMEDDGDLALLQPLRRHGSAPAARPIR